MYILTVMLRFRSKYGQNPDPCKKEEHLKNLYKLRDEVLTKLEVPLDEVSDSFFR